MTATAPRSIDRRRAAFRQVDVTQAVAAAMSGGSPRNKVLSTNPARHDNAAMSAPIHRIDNDTPQRLGDASAADALDMSAPSAAPRRRRQVAVTQATIARAGRVAQSLGPEWRVEIEGDVVRLVQAGQSTDRSPHVPIAPVENIRL